jgi:hypothetical protein
MYVYIPTYVCVHTYICTCMYMHMYIQLAHLIEMHSQGLITDAVYQDMQVTCLTNAYNLPPRAPDAFSSSVCQANKKVDDVQPAQAELSEAPSGTQGGETDLGIDVLSVLPIRF